MYLIVKIEAISTIAQSSFYILQKLADEMAQ